MIGKFPHAKLSYTICQIYILKKEYKRRSFHPDNKKIDRGLSSAYKEHIYNIDFIKLVKSLTYKERLLV